jgi:hypothetical protein
MPLVTLFKSDLKDLVLLGKGTTLWLCEGTPLFSRPYLYSEGAVTQYLGFKEAVADSQKLRGVNPRYWVTAMPGGIFFEIWPLEKGRTLTVHHCGEQSTRGPASSNYFIYEGGYSDGSQRDTI